MNLITRKILLITFVTTFFIVSPLMVLYAFGYHLNWQNKSWQRTGMFVIKTNPTEVDIYINDELQTGRWDKKITSPAKIKGIFPGEYQVRLESDGYWPWEKRLTVQANETVFIEDVRLFRNNLPRQIATIDISTLTTTATSPNNKQQLIVTENKLISINLDKQETNTLYEFVGSQPESFTWSPDNKYILADNLLFDINQSDTFTDLQPLLKTNAHNIKWQTNNELAYTTGSTIYNFDINNQVNELTYSQDNNLIKDFLSKDNNLYFISSANEEINLTTINLNNDEKQISELPPSTSYKFIETNNQWLNLYDDKNNIFYIIDNQTLLLKQLPALSCNHYQWVDNNTLLYADGFEIWLWEMENNKKRLLTRVSESVTKVIWHPNNNYVIYSTASQINSLELDSRDRHHTNELIKADNIQHLHISTDGNKLYFFTTLGQQPGLYELII